VFDSNVSVLASAYGFTCKTGARRGLTQDSSFLPGGRLITAADVFHLVQPRLSHLSIAIGIPGHPTLEYKQSTHYSIVQTSQRMVSNGAKGSNVRLRSGLFPAHELLAWLLSPAVCLPAGLLVPWPGSRLVVTQVASCSLLHKLFECAFLQYVLL
jgi:hypothetical protein